MRIRIGGLLFITLVVNNLSAQTKTLADSLSNEICKTISMSNEKNDSIKIVSVFHEVCYGPVLLDYSEKTRDSIVDRIFFRLQRNCSLFKEIYDNIFPNNPRFAEIVNSKPLPKLFTEDYQKFHKIKKFRYFEERDSIVDTINVMISDKFWIESFKDGTYSKLKFGWISKCEFEIEFIESNNNIRNRINLPGDKYIFTIIEKGKNYYELCYPIAGTKRYIMFKLYY